MTPEELEYYNRQLYTERYSPKRPTGWGNAKSCQRIICLIVILGALATICYCANFVAHHYAEKARREEEVRLAAEQERQAAKQRELERERQMQAASQEMMMQRAKDEAVWEATHKQEEMLAEQRRVLEENKRVLAETQARIAAARKPVVGAATPQAPTGNSELDRALEAARQANEIGRKAGAAPRDASVSARDSSKGGALALAQAKLPKGATVIQTKFYPPGTQMNYWTCYIYFK